ncbi:MAG: ABC transporter permease [Magnetococcales bacterium]|nr:ABC transporter permease [Magnetococcales bacterium]
MMPNQESQILEERSYSAQSRIRAPGGILPGMFRDLWRSRELAGQLFLREIRQRYRQSVLGFLWILVPPLATATVFVILNARKILNIDPTDIPYPLYVLLGTLLWQIFAESVLAPLRAFDGCVAIMIKINMPREAPILTGLAQVGFFAMVQMIPALGIMLWSGVTFTWSMLLAPVAMLMLMLLGTAIGLFLVPLGGLYRDVSEGSSMALKVIFFLTPVVYPAPTSWPWSLLATLNPIVPLLQGARDLMAKGAMQDPVSFWITSALTLALLAVALLFYRLATPLVLERMGA